MFEFDMDKQMIDHNVSMANFKLNNSINNLLIHDNDIEICQID